MSATGEVEKIPVEQPGPDVVKPAEKPIKEKKPKAPPKEKRPKTSKTASHPPYFQMIKEALVALNENGGSSPYAIAKYMEEKHKAVLPSNFRKILGLQLKNSAARGKLIKIRASFKLSESVKKDNKAPTKVAKIQQNQQPKRAKSTRAAARANAAETKTEVKKTVKKAKKAKKAGSAKPKQPKSIKSAGAKRGRKSVA